MKGSFGGAISESTRADLVAQDRSAFLTVPQKTVRSLENVPGVEAAAGVGVGAAQGQGRRRHLRQRRGSRACGPRSGVPIGDAAAATPCFAKLDATHVILEDGSPIAAKVDAGDTITVTSQSGKTAKLTVLGFYRDQMAYTGMMVNLDALKKLDVPTAAGMTLVRSDGSAGRPGRGPEGARRLPDAEGRDQDRVPRQPSTSRSTRS